MNESQENLGEKKEKSLENAIQEAGELYIYLSTDLKKGHEEAYADAVEAIKNKGFSFGSVESILLQNKIEEIKKNNEKNKKPIDERRVHFPGDKDGMNLKKR